MLEMTASTRFWNWQKCKIVFRPLPSDDPTQRRPDLTLAKEKLNYEPTVHVKDGLLKTIEYFRTVL